MDERCSMPRTSHNLINCHIATGWWGILLWSFPPRHIHCDGVKRPLPPPQSEIREMSEHLDYNGVLCLLIFKMYVCFSVVDCVFVRVINRNLCSPHHSTECQFNKYLCSVCTRPMVRQQAADDSNHIMLMRNGHMQLVILIMRLLQWQIYLVCIQCDGHRNNLQCRRVVENEREPHKFCRISIPMDPNVFVWVKIRFPLRVKDQ